MKSRVGFIRTTIIGGFVFLIPAVIVVIALGKLLGALKGMGQAISTYFGIETLVGGLALDLLAIAVTLLLCFVGGLLAKLASAKRVRAKLDATLLNSFPGYAFVKGITDNLRHSEELAGSFVPVLVQFDDHVQVAFETQREPSGEVAVYLPGAPNPWSGSVVYVSSDRIKPLSMTLAEVLRNIRSLGKNPVEIANQEQKVGTA